MHIRSGASAVFSVLLGLTGSLLVPELAQGMLILDAERSIFMQATYYDPDIGNYIVTQTRSDPVGFGPWSSGLSGGMTGQVSVSQSSLISQVELSGTGTVRMYTTYDNVYTIYRVVFGVIEPSPYELSVDNLSPWFYGPCGLGCTSPRGHLTLDRVDPVDPNVILESLYEVNFWTGNPDVSGQGTLAPGTYVLDYYFQVPGSHWSEPADDFGDDTTGFVLHVVPEPATGVLLLLGVTWLSRVRRRDRSRRPADAPSAHSGA